MGQATDQFWDVLHERWRGSGPRQEAMTVRAALVHFMRRLPAREYRHMVADLPADLQDLWAEPEIEAKRQGLRPIEKSDYEGFLSSVSREGGLDGPAEAERAVAAVLHALRPFIGETERAHLAHELPEGLEEMWIQEMRIAAVARHGESGARGPGGG